MTDRAAVGEGTAEPPEAVAVVEFAGETAVAATFADIKAALNLDDHLKGGRGLDNTLPLYLLHRCRLPKAIAYFSKIR